MAKSPNVLDIQNLKKRYGNVDVLHDINLGMEDGEFLVLLGPSGCGKSTLLNCIAGLETITGGHIRIGDKDMTETPPGERDIAMVFQSYALYPTMSVGENITFGLKVRGENKAIQQQELARVADILQIGQLLDRKPSELSGGQRQRVAMGRALVRNPALYLFDEPLSNLDAKLRVEMRAEIKNLHQRVDASIIYVTHDQIEAMTLASRICILKDGYIQQIGTPDEVYYRPANVYVATFMGSPPMNILDASTLSAQQVRLSSAVNCTLPVAPPSPPAFLFGLRPEDAQICGPNEGMFDQPLTVNSLEKTGADTFVSAKIGAADFIIRDQARSQLSPGDQFNITAQADALNFFDKDSGIRL